MKPKVLWVLLVFFWVWSSPAAADNRFIVRAPSGPISLQQNCLVLGCNVAGGLDGDLGKLFLVTTPVDLTTEADQLLSLVGGPESSGGV